VISDLNLQLASLSAPVEQGSQQTPFVERLARRTMGEMRSAVNQAAVPRHPAWGPGDDLLVHLKTLQPRLRDLRARRVEQESQQTPFAERLARRTMGKMRSAAVSRHPAWGPGDDLLVQLRMLQPRLRDLRARRLRGRP